MHSGDMGLFPRRRALLRDAADFTAAGGQPLQMLLGTAVPPGLASRLCSGAGQFLAPTSHSSLCLLGRNQGGAFQPAIHPALISSANELKLVPGPVAMLLGGSAGVLPVAGAQGQWAPSACGPHASSAGHSFFLSPGHRSLFSTPDG